MSLSILPSLKAAGQDHEFYPTTNAIIAAMIADLRKEAYHSTRSFTLDSFLDIGAGNGKVIEAIRKRTEELDDKNRHSFCFSSFYAIEKSEILINQLDPDIIIVGTEFHEQSLFGKSPSVTFCNPPYSEFVAWAAKIIRQSNSPFIYLVIPDRWRSKVEITDALRFRNTKANVVGSFDFIDSEDRTARAKVELLRIRINAYKSDAFDAFFEEEFGDLIKAYGSMTQIKGEQEKERRNKAEIIPGKNFVESLVELYSRELAHIERNYRAVATLDPDLLREFDVYPERVKKGLWERITNLKSHYWNELFNNLDKVTNRLTTGSRKSLLGRLQQHAAVDFTLRNIYAVLVWVIKNANIYLDSQLVDTYTLMIDKCNVQMYASNRKTWQDEGWRYTGDKNTKFALDYRIVTHRVGGIRTGYSFERGLDERAAYFMQDLLTIAYNLGFACDTSPTFLHPYHKDHWVSGKVFEFYGKDREGNRCTLIEARAFQNGNLHLRLNQKLILALNVEFGRLKGWLRSGPEAAIELNTTDAIDLFESNLRLEQGNAHLLLTA